MDIEKLLNQILRKYKFGMEDSRKLKAILNRVEKATATYADAQQYAQEVGRILTEALREYLPEALTDGRLYRAFADVLVKTPAERAVLDVAQVTKDIQNILNDQAGIGLRSIVPELNKDQIDGIITGIVNADSFDGNKEEFFDQIASFFEGYVDDFARENADFQYEAGLSPTVERIADGKCCSWCAALAGSYDYRSVKDKGNDIWKRHNNCHCQILFNPAGSKRRK
jgi:hypothetical protein